MFTNLQFSRFVPKIEWLSMLHPSRNTLRDNDLHGCKNGVLESFAGKIPRRQKLTFKPRNWPGAKARGILPRARMNPGLTRTGG